MPEYRKYRGTTGLFPQPVGKILTGVTASAVRRNGSLKARILAHWPEIAGPELAAKCSPRDLTFPPKRKDQGRLTLAVQPGFALEIQHMEPLILEKIALFTGSRAIASLRLVQA